MIDCGHNGGTSWRPGTYLRQNGISTLDMLGITNYDEDHVSGIEDLCNEVDVRWLWRNKSVTTKIIRTLKSEDGMGPGIERLVHEIDHVFTGDGSAPQPRFDGLTRQSFYNSYPTFDDENNLSMAIHLKCYGVGVMFPGDLECAGWLELLKRDDFKQALRETSVLVAPHHGRDSGCCEELFQYCKPFYIVISDRGYMYDTQKTIPFYRRFTKGGPFRDEGERHVLTTRRDGRIGFNFTVDGWHAY
jgi:beta-lactamase superfamily II metal-dependent hydrolase